MSGIFPGRMNSRGSKSFPQFFLRNRAARAAVQRERDGYLFDCLVRNLGLGTLAAPWMAQRSNATLSFSDFAEREKEVAEQPFQF
ncbi:MAG: hypothetical protein ACJ8NS_07570 [Chthoniobacterales bacterium]